MQLKNATAEEACILGLIGNLARSPRQINGFRESDAELIRLPGWDGVLAVTTDQIVEEIQAGLYDDPFLLGWMTVLVSASDLAAVGADPLGILLNITLPDGFSDHAVAEFGRGVREATVAASLPLLGGDTNRGPCLTSGSTAIGILDKNQTLTRRGASMGDSVFASGPLGLGSAFAWRKLRGGESLPFYRPEPRLAVGRLVRRFATACIDTSDGAIAALDLLMQINHVAMELDADWDEVLHPEARRLAAELGESPWPLLAGPHGEFELLFTVPAINRHAFLTAAPWQGFVPLHLGQVIPGEAGNLVLSRDRLRIDAGAVRRLHDTAGRDPVRFLEKLQECLIGTISSGGVG